MSFDDIGDQISVGAGGAYFSLENVNLDYEIGNSVEAMLCGGGVKVKLDNVILSASVSGTLAGLFKGSGAGGFTAAADNCDFSLLTGYILDGVGSNGADDDLIDIRISNCKMPNSSPLRFCNEDFANESQYFLATNCSDAAAEAEYQFFQKTMSGTVEDSGDDGTAGGIYRAKSTAFAGGNKVSFKCQSTALCGEGFPLSFDMPARFADLTAGATDALTVYIASATALTQANTWIEVSYPDATNKQLWKTTTSRLADILGTTALTADGGASDWENAGTDLTTENEYKITVTAVTGAACVPHVKVFCTVPSITFYVDTTIDLG